MKNLTPYDQFFLNDYDVVQKLVNALETKKTDTVLEIGPGRGVITREIASRAKKVIAIEIDHNFAKSLSGLPKNVEIVFGNVLVLFNKIKFNKIISNLPSSVIEPFFNNLINKDFELMAALIPLKFIGKLNGPVLTTYFETKLIENVKRDSFAPQPKTNWALVRISPKADPLSEKDYDRYIRKYLIEHPKAKLKNALMEAVIKIYKNENRAITKNQARNIVNKLEIPRCELEENFNPKTDLYKLSANILNFL